MSAPRAARRKGRRSRKGKPPWPRSGRERRCRTDPLQPQEAKRCSSAAERAPAFPTHTTPPSQHRPTHAGAPPAAGAKAAPAPALPGPAPRPTPATKPLPPRIARPPSRAPHRWPCDPLPPPPMASVRSSECGARAQTVSRSPPCVKAGCFCAPRDPGRAPSLKVNHNTPGARFGIFRPRPIAVSRAAKWPTKGKHDSCTLHSPKPHRLHHELARTYSFKDFLQVVLRWGTIMTACLCSHSLFGRTSAHPHPTWPPLPQDHAT